MPIDIYGIGTHLVTGGAQSSLNGVYKLAATCDTGGNITPVMKLSNSFEKATNPEENRSTGSSMKSGLTLGDLITLEHETISEGEDIMFHHPVTDADYFMLRGKKYHTIRPLLTLTMKEGKRMKEPASLKAIQERVSQNLETFHSSYLRMINPHIYKVSLSKELKDLKTSLVLQAKTRQQELER